MSPIVHLVLLVFALCCFALDAYQSPGPTRVTSLGLAFLAGSMLSW